jgi:hypothetical protein
VVQEEKIFEMKERKGFRGFLYGECSHAFSAVPSDAFVAYHMHGRGLFADKFHFCLVNRKPLYFLNFQRAFRLEQLDLWGVWMLSQSASRAHTIAINMLTAR